MHVLVFRDNGRQRVTGLLDRDLQNAIEFEPVPGDAVCHLQKLDIVGRHLWHTEGGKVLLTARQIIPAGGLYDQRIGFINLVKDLRDSLPVHTHLPIQK